MRWLTAVSGLSGGACRTWVCNGGVWGIVSHFGMLRAMPLKGECQGLVPIPVLALPEKGTFDIRGHFLATGLG